MSIPRRPQVWLNFFLLAAIVSSIDHRVNATEAIAFCSPGLIPTLTNGFWLDFANRVLIENFRLKDALPQLLAATSTAAFVRHTNLLYVRIPRSKDQPVMSWEYVWSHPDFRPFGRRLPANCVKCGCLNSFGSPIKLTPRTGTTYIFSCSGKDTSGQPCRAELTAEPMDGFEPFGQSQNRARWMVKKVATVI